MENEPERGYARALLNKNAVPTAQMKMQIELDTAQVKRSLTRPQLCVRAQHNMPQLLTSCYCHTKRTMQVDEKW